MEILGQGLAQGVIPAIIVVIYLIAVKYIDNKKEQKQVKLNSELIKSISNISSFITAITKNTIKKDEEKCKKAINESLNAAAYNFIRFVSNTVVNNHIDTNKDSIISTITILVNAEYYNIWTTLNLYEINGVKVSDYLKKDWMKQIEDAIIDSIYNTALSKEEKITNFSNKIDIKFQNIITYIINNAMK